jgi:CysZ protein
VISVLLNSYLLGREFFESAAGYHIGKAEAKKFRQQHRKIVYGGGFAITIMTLLPVLNMFVPLLAIVWMVHVYHAVTSMRGSVL